jgi:hypothetical protein
LPITEKITAVSPDPYSSPGRVAPSGVSKVTVCDSRMSSRGAAVGFPGAMADSTGVTGINSLVGEGSCSWRLGVAGAQALIRSTKDTTRQEAKRRVFIHYL